MHKPSEEKIEQWCEFIVDHLYVNDLMAFRDLQNTEKYQFSCPKEKTKQKSCCMQMFSNLDNHDYNAFYLTDIDEIKNVNKYMNFKGDKNSPDYQAMKSRADSLLDENPEKSNKFAKMTNREYLKWRLGVINDEQKPISIKKTTGLAFLSLIGIYWFFAPKTKPSIKILMGILNLFVVPALVCAIVFDLSLYFLIPAAIVYGLFVLAGCIHVGLRRYKEEEFSNTCNELMEYLNQTEPPKSLGNKINELNQGQENLSEIKEEKKEKNMSQDI